MLARIVHIVKSTSIAKVPVLLLLKSPLWKEGD